jgi:hypothetical protein
VTTTRNLTNLNNQTNIRKLLIILEHSVYPNHKTYLVLLSQTTAVISFFVEEADCFQYGGMRFFDIIYELRK